MNCRGIIEKGTLKLTCSKPIFRCERCGATGCDNRYCKNQRFDGGRCTICGGNLKRAVI